MNLNNMWCSADETQALIGTAPAKVVGRDVTWSSLLTG
jgi:hypothetical protein